MSMTAAVTRNVPARFSGFLASCMLEVGPGVYVSPDMRKAVRERIWGVMLQWAGLLGEDGGLMLLWRDRQAPSGLSIRTLGWPKAEVLSHEGVWLTRHELTAEHDLEELQRLAEKGSQDEEP